jgi:hypothetical protein
MSPRRSGALLLSLLVLAAGASEAQRRPPRRPRRAATARVSRPSGTGPGPFAGVWVVSSNTEVSVTSPVLRTETRQTRERVAVSPGAGSDLALDVTNERGESCRLQANRSGSTLTFPPEQQCFFTDPVQGIAFAFTLQRGTGAVRGATISLDFSWTVFANIGMAINGTAVQRSTGSMGDMAPVAQPMMPGAMPQPSPRTW